MEDEYEVTPEVVKAEDDITETTVLNDTTTCSQESKLTVIIAANRYRHSSSFPKVQGKLTFSAKSVSTKSVHPCIFKVTVRL